MGHWHVECHTVRATGSLDTSNMILKTQSSSLRLQVHGTKSKMSCHQQSKTEM